MAVFPLSFVPTSYRAGGGRFGAPRDGGSRTHAGCDLYAPDGTPVRAVTGGTVIQQPYPFPSRDYQTVAIEVRHPDFIARYGEVRAAAGLGAGSQVTEGQVIAYVQRMTRDSMLHFEMYSNPGLATPLTDRSRQPYQRRADLVDPTPYLDQWAQSVQAQP